MAGQSVRDMSRRMNEATRGLFEHYLPQRQRVTALATAAIRPLGRTETTETTGTLAIPGAGNCNDLDLPVLAETFERVDLIDLDAEAMQQGLRRAFPAGPPDNVRAIGPVDLTGLGKRPRNAPPVQEKSLKFVTKLEKHRPSEIEDGQYDRVISSSMVGTLIGNLAAVMTGKHKLFAKSAFAIRDAHLHQLVDMLRPGGLGIITLELVSSDIIPDLAKWNHRQLLPAFDQIVRQGPCFPGAHPEQIGHVLAETRQITVINGLSPWRLALGPRVYLMYGLTFLKKHPGEAIVSEAGAATEHQIIDSIDFRDSMSSKVTPTDDQGLLMGDEQTT